MQLCSSAKIGTCLSFVKHFLHFATLMKQNGAEAESGSDEGEDFLVRKGAPDTHLSDEEEVCVQLVQRCHGNRPALGSECHAV